VGARQARAHRIAGPSAQGVFFRESGTDRWNIAATTGVFNNDATNGGSIQFNKAGTYVQAAIQVPTAVATPVTGTNFCGPGVCAVPTNAANNAVFIGQATPNPGEQFLIANKNGTNLIRAKAAGGATINGAVAGGYIGLAANTSMHCYYDTAATLICDYYSGGAVPTPAGP
jgi:hypothetical protein